MTQDLTTPKGIATATGLTYREVTTQRNGYPEPITGYLVYGFNTFAEAEEFAEKHGGTVSYGSWKGGWSLCNVNGQAWGPLTYQNYLHDLGDNYGEVTLNNNWHGEQLTELAEDLKEAEADEIPEILTKIEDVVKRQRELLELFENKEDDEVVIYGPDSFEVVKKEMMEYTEDVTTNVIGVYFDYSAE